MRALHSRRTLWILPVLAAVAACDPPPSDRPPGTGAAELPIQAVQNESDPAHPSEGERVLFRDVLVLAVDDYDEDGEGRTGSVWVGEAGGGSWSGVQLFNPTVVPTRVEPRAGDIVQVLGAVDEFVLLDDAGNPMDRNGTLTEIVDAVVQKTGETFPPPPTDVTENDLGERSRAEPYEGVLVRLRNVRVVSGYDRYDEATTEGGIKIANDLYEAPELNPEGFSPVTLRSLTGVVTYFFGFKLLPRGPEDIEF